MWNALKWIFLAVGVLPGFMLRRDDHYRSATEEILGEVAGRAMDAQGSFREISIGLVLFIFTMMISVRIYIDISRDQALFWGGSTTVLLTMLWHNLRRNYLEYRWLKSLTGDSDRDMCSQSDCE